MNITSTTKHQLILNISQAIVEVSNVRADNSLLRYKELYRNYHGIISIFVCIFGLTCNLFNIIVLTRPSMRSSTNVILTSLAISDLIKMLFVLPAAILFYCLQVPHHKSEPNFSSYFQVTFYMIQMLIALTLHCISTWLTVILAAFRHIFLSYRSLAAYVSRIDRAWVGVGTVVVISTILCIPSYIEHRIVKVVNNDTSALPLYRYEEAWLSKYLSLRGTVFVLHSVMFKLIPCVLLIVFSILLIYQLRNALAAAEKLQQHSKTVNSTNNVGRMRGRRREKENRRTTLMLIIVCVLFLITELPQGAILLLAFLSRKQSKYYYLIYQHLGDTFDILALINNSVNFILYCLMSRAFRDTFKQTFCFCKKYDHRESNVSMMQITLQKQQPLSLSVAGERLSTQIRSINRDNCRMSNDTDDRQNMPSTIHTFNHSVSIPLLTGNKSNGLEKHHSCSS